MVIYNEKENEEKHKIHNIEYYLLAIDRTFVRAGGK